MLNVTRRMVHGKTDLITTKADTFSIKVILKCATGHVATRCAQDVVQIIWNLFGVAKHFRVVLEKYISKINVPYIIHKSLSHQNADS